MKPSDHRCVVDVGRMRNQRSIIRHVQGGKPHHRGELVAAKDATGADQNPCGELYEADMLVEGRVLVENKAIGALAPRDVA